MNVESLKNQGFAFSMGASTQESQEKKTFIVVGVARGGTSIVAGTLAKLGVFMGGAQSPVYEDLRLSLAYEKTSQEKFEDVISDYNSKHSVWAWKRPSTLNDLPKIAKKLRNPHFIFVFRDLLSVANRNAISMKKGLKVGLSDGLKDYSKILKFIGKNTYPSFYVSSEKAVSNKESFLDAVSYFCQLTPTVEQRNAIYNFISPNPEEYLDKTRIDLSVGWVDKWLLQTGILQGWAHYPSQPNKVADIQVLVNEEIKLTIKADQCIKLNNKSFQDKASKYGFRLDLRSHEISPQDNIQLQVEDAHSPFESASCSHLTRWLTQEEIEKQSQPKWGLNRPFLITGILRGWATGRYANKAVNIIVKVNGDMFAMIPAAIMRPHLKKVNIHPTGECGFELNLKQLGVKPTDSIEVSIEGESEAMHDNPISFPELSKWLTQKDWNEMQQKKTIKVDQNAS